MTTDKLAERNCRFWQDEIEHYYSELLYRMMLQEKHRRGNQGNQRCNRELEW